MKKKIILVTGGSGTIGASIVQQLAMSNEHIICLQYSNNLTKALIIKQEHENIFLFQQDFFEELHLIKDVINKFGKIDVLINCAGIIASNSIFDMDSYEFDKIFHLNTKIPYLLSSQVYNVMKEYKYGRIINISSITVKYGMGRNNSIHYAGSKSALESLTIGLSRMGAEHNILVNTIRPGAINSEIQNKRADIIERINMIPVKRLGKSEEIAHMVNFLISSKGDFITGQTITIGGGE